MRTEALEAPAVVENQFSENQQLLDEVAQYLNQKNPYSLVSIARGSSDHAAQYLNFLTTAKLGKLTTSLSMSAITLYSASAGLIAAWKNDLELTRGLHHLPDDLLKAQQLDWTAPLRSLQEAKRIMIVGRGYGLALALEAALKLKETCSIQAEAFSAAEIKHGPQALIEDGYPLLIFANRGPALHSMLDLAADMKARGANVILAAPQFVKEKQLEIQTTHAEELDVITAIQSFYLMAEELSRNLGLNPDAPKHLSKITRTE